jgi:hypothetical protein
MSSQMQNPPMSRQTLNFWAYVYCDFFCYFKTEICDNKKIIFLNTLYSPTYSSTNIVTQYIFIYISQKGMIEFNCRRRLDRLWQEPLQRTLSNASSTIWGSGNSNLRDGAHPVAGTELLKGRGEEPVKVIFLPIELRRPSSTNKTWALVEGLKGEYVRRRFHWSDECLMNCSLAAYVVTRIACRWCRDRGSGYEHVAFSKLLGFSTLPTVLILEYTMFRKLDLFRKIWSFRGRDYEERCSLGCYAVWLL